METDGKPHSADENIRRLRKLQQDAQHAFREQITRHRAEVVARQNDFRENFPPPMAQSVPPESDPDESSVPEETSEPSVPVESDEALTDLIFPEEATEMPASLAPEDALPEDVLPEVTIDRSETVRAPSKVEGDRLARRRSHRLQARRVPPHAMNVRHKAEPDSDHTSSPTESTPPPPSEPEEELSVEEQKVLDEIEIFETLWQKKDAREAQPSSPPPPQTGKKRRSFFGSLFDMSPHFRDAKTEDEEERF